MILCLCRGIVGGVVDAVIAQGASTLEEIAAACEAGADCGACHVSLLDLLAAARPNEAGVLCPAGAGATR